MCGLAPLSTPPDFSTLYPNIQTCLHDSFTHVFRLLFAEGVSFTVDDDTPSATLGQAEQREYQFRGVIGGDEIGQPSDIARATFTPQKNIHDRVTVTQCNSLDSNVHCETF